MRDSEPEFAREAELKRIEHSYRTNVRFREPMDRLNLEGRISAGCATWSARLGSRLRSAANCFAKCEQWFIPLLKLAELSERDIHGVGKSLRRVWAWHADQDAAEGGESRFVIQV